jgi:putative ATP-binding cassette transporter
LSATTPLPLFGADLAFPGYLVWLALLYAGLGTLIAHWIGWRLIPLNFNQQRYESDFRFAIVRAADHSEPVGLMRGEPVERVELGRRFGNLVRNWTALVSRQTRLTGFIAGYSNISTVFPTLVVAPAYLVGAIPLGILVQAALAFQKVEGAFAFCIAAYSKLAEWKAIMDRLAQVEAAMDKVEAQRARGEGIEVTPAHGRNLEVSALDVRLPDGAPIAEFPAVSLAPGARMLLTGPSGSGKSSVFRALTGLWPLGEGRVETPNDILVMPQRPYFPLGTLRQAVAYPTPANDVSEAALRSAMNAVGLDHLLSRLDEEADWSVMLSGGEQQRVAFVRVLLRRPAVLMFDEPVATLDDAAGRELYRTLIERLPDTIILSIDRRAVLREFHTQTIEMKADAASPRMAAVPA